MFCITSSQSYHTLIVPKSSFRPLHLSATHVLINSFCYIKTIFIFYTKTKKTEHVSKMTIFETRKWPIAFTLSAALLDIG